MSVSPQQLLDDLRGEFRGRLAVDPPTRTLYATDASPFQIMPFAVAAPVDESDLQTLVRYAHEQSIALIPRGAGTGLAGESLGWGIIVDLTSGFRSIREIRDSEIVAEVGVTHAEINRALMKQGRRFAPDPASSSVCTLGGMLATNASGGNSFVHGYTRDHTHALRVIWDDGEAATISRPTLNRRAEAGSPRLIEIRTQTAALLAANRALIQVTRPLTAYNRCGYVLHDVLSTQGLDLPRLMVGSEGTLGIMTEATLATVPVAPAVGAAMLGFQSLNDALRAGLTLRAAEGIVSCDLLDQRLIRLSRNVDLSPGINIPQEITAVLILTIEGDSRRSTETLTRQAVERARRSQSSAVLAGPTIQAQELQAILHFRSAVVAGLYALGSSARPLSFIEDLAVPGEELVRFVAGVSEILRRHQLSASFLIHVLTGQVHARPLIDLNNPADRARLWPVADAVFTLAINLGGTISGQHGTGLARTPWVEKQYGPLMPIFRDLKRIFDPKDICNPGKIVGPDPSHPAWPLRVEVPLEPPAEAPRRTPLLHWSTPPEREASQCHGCADCRTREAPTRMCPTFHALGTEASSPRAQANLFRLIQESAATEGVESDVVREIIKNCVNCKMCQSECRSRVNIPKLALEAKAAHHAEHGLERDEWFMARIEGLSRLASLFSYPVNWMLGNRRSRWILEKLFGLHRERRLQQVTHRSFLRRAKQAGWSRPPSATPPDSTEIKLAYFVDTFANHVDPQIAEAVMAILHHHGLQVYVPQYQYGSGTPALNQGDLDLAADVAERHVRQFADLVRSGYHILCSEPSAAVALTQDYPDILGTADAQLVAENTLEITDFLWGLHDTGELRIDFENRIPVHLGHHVPCHIKALGGEPAGPRLLRLIPGVEVTTIDKSCSGMAGTYGLHVKTYAASLAAGEPMLAELRRPQIVFGSSECSSCRMQMQEGTGKRALHPVLYLALAYGLLPGIEHRLHQPLGELVSE